MMWFTADLHLGDTNILHDMDRPFGSVEEMNRKVIDAINECVAADDRLYILGDFTYRLPLAEAVRLRERIECQNVTLIRGNHDGDWEDSDVPRIWEDVRDYLEIAPGYAKGHRLVMSHYPMLSWNGKARGAIMLHGHIHSRGDRANARNRDRERPIFRYDVGLDANEYKPVSRDQILSFFGLQGARATTKGTGTFVVVLAPLPLWRRRLFCPRGAVECSRLIFASIEELL